MSFEQATRLNSLLLARRVSEPSANVQKRFDMSALSQNRLERTLLLYYEAMLKRYVTLFMAPSSKDVPLVTDLFSKTYQASHHNVTPWAYFGAYYETLAFQCRHE